MRLGHLLGGTWALGQTAWLGCFECHDEETMMKESFVLRTVETTIFTEYAIPMSLAAKLKRQEANEAAL